jgi:hypothetical protein
MAKISIDFKKQLGELVGKFYEQQGYKVLPRRPYREKDEDGGEGSIAEHPAFANLPISASSDLTFLMNFNSQVLQAALDRAGQMSPELRMRLQYALNLQMQNRARPSMTPTPRPFGGA